VKSGDTGNAEGQAAAVYWAMLFEETEYFTRGRFDMPPNNMLNYGYAILRGVIARNLVGSGMLPVLGIHHRNKYNSFCLADDIMEPYRPFVDQLIVELMQEPGFDCPEELTKELKTKLLQIPVIDVEIGGMSSPLMVASQRTTASLMRCFEGESRKIMYPELK
jgi:CRISPR-associated protein Cas1